MKNKVLVLMVGSSMSIFAQGFVNLGFESSRIPSSQTPGFVLFSDAFPEWSGYYGSRAADSAFYNSLSIGSTTADLWGPPVQDSRIILDGLFTAVLQAGDSPTGHEPCALYQSGLVPINANSVLFKASGNDFDVKFNGTSLPTIPLSTTANYTEYGADISAFSGTSGELRFTALPTSFHAVYLDSISFSTQQVPEPTTVALLAGGIALLGIHWNRGARK